MASRDHKNQTIHKINAMNKDKKRKRDNLKGTVVLSL